MSDSTSTLLDEPTLQKKLKSHVFDFGLTPKKKLKLLRKRLPFTPPVIDLKGISHVISIFGAENFNFDVCSKLTAPTYSAGEKLSSELCIDPKKNISYTDPALKKISGHFGKNIVPTEQFMPSYEYKTRKEFEKLYLDGLRKDEKKIMVKLFILIFTEDMLSNAMEKGSYFMDDEFDNFERLLFTKLSPFDKVPCKNTVLWELFRRCIDNRINGLKGEFFRLRKILPQENQEVRMKLYLRSQLLRLRVVLDEKGRACINYTGNRPMIEMKASDAAILDLIRRTVKDFFKKEVPEGQGEYALEALLDEIKKLPQAKITEEPTSIYADMLSVVQVTLQKMKSVDMGVDAVIAREKVRQDRLGVIDSDLDQVRAREWDRRDKLETIDNELGLLSDIEGVRQKRLEVIDGDLDVLSQMQKGGALREGEGEGEAFKRFNKIHDALKPNAAASEKEEGAGAEAEDDAEEEYERVYSTAMSHLEEIKSKDLRKRVLETVCETLGGTDLESSIEMAVTRKGFSVSATMNRLEDIDPKAKSFLRCVETLLEIKDRQMKAYEVPAAKPGLERYSAISIPVPSVDEVKHMSKDELKAFEKKMRRVYPYTDSLLEDMHIIRKSPSPCCLFYSAMLLKGQRKACKEIADMPSAKAILEEVLTKVAQAVADADGDADADAEEVLTYKQIDLPSGFSAIAEAVRTLDVELTLPITIHESSPPEFTDILGEKPFLLIGKGTTLHGIRDMEIDVTEELTNIRKNEIPVGALMFLYLCIKCDGHIDD
jgi:hypothetical protein